MSRYAMTVAASLLGCSSALGVVDPGPAAPPRMEYVPLPPGSYHLERIQAVHDALLLDQNERPVRMATITEGRVTLLTFFYTYCMDPLGCPFAHVTLKYLRDRILADHELARAVRFVSVSCDPTTDTPAVLKQYAKEFANDSGFEWRFLTARSVPALLPVLDDFGQDVSVELDDHGQPTRTLHHMLKVFLIDRRGIVREIYTVAFIQPEVMLNDIRSLYVERNVAGRTAKAIRRRP